MEKRTFKQYLKDNWSGSIAIVVGVILSGTSFALGGSGGVFAGCFFALTAIVTIVASYIDYKRLG